MLRQGPPWAFARFRTCQELDMNLTQLDMLWHAGVAILALQALSGAFMHFYVRKELDMDSTRSSGRVE